MAPAGPGPGDRLPPFRVEDQFGQPVTEAAFARGLHFLVFYPFAFSRVCTAELGLLERSREAWAARGVSVWAASVDHKYALRAYADQEGLGFPLLADFWPHGAMASAFGCFDAEHGRAGRHTFLVADGAVVDRFASPPGTARAPGRYASALAQVAGGSADR